MEFIEVQSITGVMVKDITKVWKASVIETHTFLSKEEIDEIELYVPQAIAEIEKLIIAIDKNEIVGFMGIENDKLEMLFIDPNVRGKGLGKTFINKAVKTYEVQYVDVNEDNDKALGFYEHMGFKVFERSPLDSQGKPYPILHMKYKG